MKRRFKIVLISFLVVLLVIQFIRPARNISGQALPSDFFSSYTAPQNVQALVKNSCYDCHSNNTRYPWYSNVQPFAWLLSRHIKEGKKELNFSEFGSYAHRRQLSKLKNIKSSIQDGSMPLSSYTLIHKSAKLSEEEKKTVIDWLDKIQDSLMNDSSVH